MAVAAVCGGYINVHVAGRVVDFVFVRFKEERIDFRVPVFPAQHAVDHRHEKECEKRRDHEATDDRATASKRAGVSFDLAPPAVAGWENTGFAVNGAGAMGAQEHYYYCQGGWVIQFNFQHSPDLDAEALETAFLAGFPLPEKH